MIVLVRREDNRIMNILEGSDWRKVLADKKAGITKGMKLQQLREEFENTPEKETFRRRELQQEIETLQAQWEAWVQRRQQLCAKQCGGVASDYFPIDIPSEDIQKAFQSRYIEYDGEALIYDTRPRYQIEGARITCTAGWVHLNERLLEDDVTDFSELEITEPLFFQLWYGKEEATHEVTVQLLIRAEDEEFSEFPKNLIKRGENPVCEGRINPEHTITLGRF